MNYLAWGLFYGLVGFTVFEVGFWLGAITATKRTTEIMKQEIQKAGDKYIKNVLAKKEENKK